MLIELQNLSFNNNNVYLYDPRISDEERYRVIISAFLSVYFCPYVRENDTRPLQHDKVCSSTSHKARTIFKERS